MVEKASELKDLLSTQTQEFTKFTHKVSSTLDACAEGQNKLKARIQQLEAECQQLRRPPESFDGHQNHLTDKPLPSVAAADSEVDVTDGIIKAWSFYDHESPVHSVAIAKHLVAGRRHLIAATASWEGKVHLFSANEQGSFQKCLEQKSGVYCVSFTRKYNLLGCASADHSVHLYTWEDGKYKRSLVGHKGEVNSVDFHFKQDVACSASDDKSVIIWDYNEGAVLRNLDEHESEVYGARFINALDGELNGDKSEFLVATCCFDKKTRIFDMRDKKVVKALANHTDDIIGLDYSRTTDVLATGSDDGFVCLYDARASWRLRSKIKIDKAQNSEVKRLTFSPTGKSIAAGGSNMCVSIYSTEPPNDLPLAKLDGHTDCVFDVAWATIDDRNIVVSASHDHKARVWELAGNDRF